MADVEAEPVAPGAVEPFYFGGPLLGESPRGAPRLFGCLHPGVERYRGAVICYPFGHEYIAIHRAARLLGTQLSRAGLPTLRFDYSGTGDSEGSLEATHLEQWTGEVRRAVDELRMRAGVERVTLVGVRLGGALALRAASRRDDIEALALWDPVIWGRGYLRELKRDSRRMRRVAHVLPGPQDKSRPELLGFAIGPQLANDLRRLELDTVEPPPVERILLLESRRAASAPLGASLRAGGCRVETRTDDLPRLWRWSEDITKIELPHSHVRALVRWVAEGAL